MVTKQQEQQVQSAQTLANNLEKFGVKGHRIPVTRVLARPLSYQAQGDQVSEAFALIMINDRDGVFSAGNVYRDKDVGWKFGVHYNPDEVQHPLPGERDSKWKDWESRGYRDVDVAQFDVLEKIAA